MIRKAYQLGLGAVLMVAVGPAARADDIAGGALPVLE